MISELASINDNCECSQRLMSLNTIGISLLQIILLTQHLYEQRSSQRLVLLRFIQRKSEQTVSLRCIKHNDVSLYIKSVYHW